MGFNTTVFFLNDFWHEVQENPEGTIRFIGEAMHDGGQNRHYVTVMRTAHADYLRLYATWQNQIIELSPDDESVREYLQLPHGSDHLDSVIRQARQRLDRVAAVVAEHKSRPGP